DQFNYTVDGKYQGSVSVYFRSLLADDSLVVDQNSRDNPALPLQNDFNPDYNSDCPPYAGSRRITSVGAAEHGGTVSLAADGKTVRYTPPADYQGEDRFTYVVDGLMEATVSVHVVRRVRDDAFRVAPDRVPNDLAVLVNDLLGADYAGAGKITAVTTTAAGGEAVIRSDGQAVLYTPPLGFTGTDRFTYTVDGKLKAEVTVSVTETRAEISPRFDSLAAFQQFLLDDALRRYESLFGQPYYNYLYDRNWLSVNGSEGDKAATATRSHSETNVQVAGVDEGDIIETDGDYLYVLSGSELIIADAWPADSLSVASRRTVRGTPIAEFLHGDRLAVISQVREIVPFWGWDDAGPQLPADAAAARSDRIGWPQPAPATTWVTVYDVADRQTPKVVQQTELTGGYVESRRIDDQVFLVLRNDQIVLPTPQPVDATGGAGNAASPADAARLLVGGTGQVYESREQYLERMAAEVGSFIESQLPRYASYGPDGQPVRTGLLVAPEDLFQPLWQSADQLVSVVSLNMGGDEPGVTSAAGIFAGGADKIYGSPEHLYVFSDDYTAEDGPVTRIMMFAWDAAGGSVDFVAKGQVAGRMLDQFSADERAGDLRLATTVSHAGAGNWTGRSENALFVLREDQGLLEFVSGIKNLALDEPLQSVRFLGDRAFVTTFRTVDPLLALDLSDRLQPRSVGHVTLPGFNSYMQFLDERYLLAVGRNAPPGGSGPTQVSLFDVQDLSHPRLVDRYTLPRFSSSEAETDHHAFGWFAEHRLLALPAARWFWERVDEDGDGYRELRRPVEEHALYLFRIDVSAAKSSQHAIQEHGQLEHPTLVRRSAFIDDVLYSIAD
nr:beta-propeller domain-containing protein [Pirellulaceae bacterium]